MGPGLRTKVQVGPVEALGGREEIQASDTDEVPSSQLRETGLQRSDGRKCVAQEQAGGEPLSQSSGCLPPLDRDIYSTRLPGSVCTWIYAACGWRMCGDCVDTHRFKGLVLGLGVQARVEVTRSKQRAGRRNAGLLHGAGQLVQRARWLGLVKPGAFQLLVSQLRRLWAW